MSCWTRRRIRRRPPWDSGKTYGDVGETLGQHGILNGLQRRSSTGDGGLEHEWIIFHFIYGIINPSHWLIFFRGVGIPPPSQWISSINNVSEGQLRTFDGMWTGTFLLIIGIWTNEHVDINGIYHERRAVCFFRIASGYCHGIFVMEYVMI